MIVQAIHPPAILTELSAMPAEERLGHVENLGGGDLMVSLVDEVERQIMADLGQAMNACEMLMPLADATANRLAMVRVRRTLGQALAYANKFDQATTHLETSAELAVENNLPIEAARARLTSVHVLARLGQYDQAILAGEKARAAFINAGELAMAAKADANLGVTHRMRDDPATALIYFERARAALADQPVVAAQLDSNRAEAMLDLNRFAEAEAAFAQALAVFESKKMIRAAAIVEGNLADLMSRQGRLEKALLHFENARRYLEADSAPGDLARLTAEQGEALAAVGMLEEAMADYEHALPPLRERGMAWEAARAGSGLGRILLRMGRVNQATAALSAAADEFARLGHSTGLAQIKLLQGEAAGSLGDSANAKAMIAEALALLSDRPALAAIAQYRLAQSHIATGDLAPAESLLAAAMDTACSLNLAPLLGDLLHARARLRQAQGRPAQAIADVRAAADQIDRVRGTLQADRFRAAFAGDRTAVYEDLTAMLLESGDPAGVAEAFATVERAKSRSLLDLVTGAIDLVERLPASADDPGEAGLLRKLGQGRSELNALYSRLDELVRGDQRRAPDPRWRIRIEQCERETQVLEGRLAATRGVGGLFAPPVDLAAAQRLLSPEVALIEYSVIHGRLIAFVVRHDAIHSFSDLASVDELIEVVERFQFQISRAVSWSAARGRVPERFTADARRELGELHRLILHPMMGVLDRAHRLIVVPHGPLHAVPFHALWDGQQHLVEQFQTSSVPSASILAQVRAAGQRQIDTVKDSLLVGVSDTLAPNIEREIHTIACAFEQPAILLGQDATVERFMNAASNANLIHVASHGRFSSTAPLSSGLKLADQWLTVRDLYATRLKARLVTLSGCDTGMAAVHRGEELVGLIRGFLAAGAKSMITSLWTLSDESAAIFMAGVYEAWHNDVDVAHGIGLAGILRDAHRRAYQRHSHPAFWAPFQLVGDT